MNLKASLIAAVAACTLLGGAAQAAQQEQTAALGIFAQEREVGDTHLAGQTRYDAATGTYVITGGGANIWGGSDAFHYVYATAEGDLTLGAAVSFETTAGDPHKKAGVMIRQSLDADSPYADVLLHNNGLIALQYRETKGGETREIGFDDSGVVRFALQKQGDYVYLLADRGDGVLHNVGGSFRLKLEGSFYAGLAVCAHNPDVVETARFSQVSLTSNPPFTPKETGYGARVESTLETIDVNSTYQRVVYHTTDHIEAPNWLPDGKTLLFNADGSLFTIPVTGGTPVQLDTGGLHRMNNDHGYSPDHQWLAVSDQSEADNQSRVYVLPLSGVAPGGQPRRLTEKGPSYWHGWSADGQTVAVIANRDGDYDIYGVPLAGGEETRLTDTPGLDDGADYSPDGKYIYFNSVRSGNMKLWRMDTDGSNPVQLTFGEDSRDWFPHPSPDGKWLAFVSFGTDVTVGDHPPNHDVTIKIMPAEGGEAKVIARLFGGQGTMNVASWSPDGKSLAFVSYRIVE